MELLAGRGAAWHAGSDFVVCHGQWPRFLASLVAPPLEGGALASPGVTCDVKQASFSYHVSNEADLGRKTSYLH